MSRTRASNDTLQDISLRAARAVFDRVYLTRLLEATGGDIPRAAELAEIHVKSFERLMRRRGVERPVKASS